MKIPIWTAHQRNIHPSPTTVSWLNPTSSWYLLVFASALYYTGFNLTLDSWKVQGNFSCQSRDRAIKPTSPVRAGTEQSDQPFLSEQRRIHLTNLFCQSREDGANKPISPVRPGTEQSNKPLLSEQRRSNLTNLSCQSRDGANYPTFPVIAEGVHLDIKK